MYIFVFEAHPVVAALVVVIIIDYSPAVGSTTNAHFINLNYIP